MSTILTAEFELQSREQTTAGFVLKLKATQANPYARIWQGTPTSTMELMPLDPAIAQAIALGAKLTLTLSTE